MELRISALLDLEHTLAKEYLSQFVYPWEALDGIKAMILALGRHWRRKSIHSSALRSGCIRLPR